MPGGKHWNSKCMPSGRIHRPPHVKPHRLKIATNLGSWWGGAPTPFAETLMSIAAPQVCAEIASPGPRDPHRGPGGHQPPDPPVRDPGGSLNQDVLPGSAPERSRRKSRYEQLVRAYDPVRHHRGHTHAAGSELQDASKAEPSQ